MGYFIIVTATIGAVIIPIQLVFSYSGRPVLITVDWLITFIFMVDILINFFRPQKFKGQRTQKKRHIAAHYLRGWFIVDLIAAIPWHVLFGVPFLMVLRCVKLAHVAKLLHHRSHREIHHSAVFRLVSFLFWLGLVSYCLACGWVALTGPIAITDDRECYLQALYWCITTLTTVGYGDIIPLTNEQRVYTIVVMILGVGMYGYVIGNVANLLSNIDRAKSHYLTNMERLSTFLKYRHIPAEIALLFSHPRTASVRAIEYCDMYRLKKDTFERVLQQHPDFAQKLKTIAHKRQEQSI